jgi:large subunit ribosomal protein L17
MRHRVKKRSFGRSPSHRRAMFRNLTRSLLLHGSLKTTEAKSKELRSHVDKLITLAKRGDLHARRQVIARIQDPVVVQMLFDDLADRFRDRPGGFTRSYKLGPRLGDAARMVQIELV